MCGICGIVSLNKKGINKNNVDSMMNKIQHRGPDDQGQFFSGDVGFGFTRLSILDLTQAGHQPMQDFSGRYTIIFNGEIYNYIELRKKLAKKGYKFKSETDTEILLNAFIEWDKKCLDYFNGMFAFAIYDKKKKRTFIARDRFGIKPFYYFKGNERFIFGSEIPPILEVLNSNRITPDYQVIFNYLVFNRTDQSTDTFFKNIKKLQHGHYIDIVDGNFTINRWYNLSDKLNKPFSSFEEYRDIFSSSIGLRLRSDVPVGVCLSGGLDSSSVVSVLLKDYKKFDLNTFSAVYGANKKGDESEYIKLYQNQLENMHFTTPSADSLFKDMDVFVQAHGEPISSTSPYAQFKVMELAKEYVKVTLDGQGADEQLGGYHYFFGNYFKELLNNIRLLKLCLQAYHYLRNHRSLFGIKSFIYFLLPKNFKTTARIKQKGYLATDFSNSYSENNIIAGGLYQASDLQEALINHFEFKLEHLLKFEDRNSMWFSLESRVPFLDYRLVEKTLAMPSDKIINKGYTKHILREAMKGILPEKIRTRQDKIGFATPEDEWFREQKFRKLISGLIRSKKFKERGIFDIGKVQSQYEAHFNGKTNISKEVWKWINLELWFRKFID